MSPIPLHSLWNNAYLSNICVCWITGGQTRTGRQVWRRKSQRWELNLICVTLFKCHLFSQVVTNVYSHFHGMNNMRRTLPGWQWGLGAHTQGFPPGWVSWVCHTTPDTEPGQGHPHYSLPDLTAAGSQACQPDSGRTHRYRPHTTPGTERGCTYSVVEIGGGEENVWLDKGQTSRQKID